jgi:hypothetical protein
MPNCFECRRPIINERSLLSRAAKPIPLWLASFRPGSRPRRSGILTTTSIGAGPSFYLPPRSLASKSARITSDKD